MSQSIYPMHFYIPTEQSTPLLFPGNPRDGSYKNYQFPIIWEGLSILFLKLMGNALIHLLDTYNHNFLSHCLKLYHIS